MVKKVACVCALALGQAAAFAPSSFMAARVAVPSATQVSGTSMQFGSFKKSAAAPAKPAAPVKKAVAPVKKAVAPVKKAVAPAVKKVAPAVKKVVAPVKKAAPVKKVAAAPKKVVAAVKKVAAPLPSAPSGSGVLAFGASAPVGFWDPLSLAADKSEETLSWYRAAELKHGRVAMLACLGSWTNAWGITLPDPVFSSGPTAKSFDVLAKVASERPGALIQILLAIAAIEVLTVQQPEGAFPGDLLWDPANQIPKFEAQGKFDELRLKELKNGRLAMLAIAGEWAQEALTGQGVFEQLAAGHTNPFGDGQGFF